MAYRATSRARRSTLGGGGGKETFVSVVAGNAAVAAAAATGGFLDETDAKVLSFEVATSPLPAVSVSGGDEIAAAAGAPLVVAADAELVECGGANSLWCESVPMKGDYAPFTVNYGEAVLFWGNRCRHYTVANDSGVTRVSFDFRFLFRRFYDPHMENIYGGPTAFLLGGYFDAIDGDGALEDISRPKGHGVLYRRG